MKWMKSFKENYELSRMCGTVTELFGKDLLELANKVCGVRLKGIPQWKREIVVSDSVILCLEVFNNNLGLTINNPLNYFYNIIDVQSTKTVRDVYVEGYKDIFDCSLVINNGRRGKDSLIAKQINKDYGSIE